jgi:hypothetical protein
VTASQKRRYLHAIISPLNSALGTLSNFIDGTTVINDEVFGIFKMVDLCSIQHQLERVEKAARAALEPKPRAKDPNLTPRNNDAATSKRMKPTGRRRRWRR